VIYLDDIGVESADGQPGFFAGSGEGFDLDSTLPLEDLPALDVRVAVHVGEIRGRADLMIDEIGFELVLDSEGIAVEKAHALFADGALKGSARVRTNTDPPTATFDLDGAAVAVHRLMAQFEQEPSASGFLDTSIGFTSRGRTLAGLRKNLDGRATFLVTEGNTRSAYLHALEFDLRRAAFGAAAPQKFEQLDCVIGDFTIERGVVRVRSLWLENPSIIIDGSGDIDLANETFALTFVPTPKQRKLLGVAATVSLSGPFAAPVVTSRKSSLATSAAKGLLAGATRPLQGVLRPVRPALDPVTDPVLKPMNPILRTFFVRHGGEDGPCGSYTPDGTAAAAPDGGASTGR
jgi:uncharacterized protein involved in outer membrane biogenesis